MASTKYPSDKPSGVQGTDTGDMLENAIDARELWTDKYGRDDDHGGHPKVVDLDGSIQHPNAHQDQSSDANRNGASTSGANPPPAWVG
jgi:hypothetical protein